MTEGSENKTSPKASAWWRQNRFPLFVASRVISLTGDVATTTALTVYVYDETKSSLAISGLFVARVLPRLFGPLAGAISDRLDLRKLMVYCDIASCVVFLLIARLDPSYTMLLAMVLLAEVAATIASPAAETVVARTVPAESRGRANGVMMAVLTVSFAGGAAIGGLSAGAWDYRVALYVNSASFVVSAVLIAGVRRMPPDESRHGSTPSMASSLRSGLRLLRVDREIMLVSVCTIGVAFAAAVDRPALVVLAERDLGSAGIGYGLALGGVSVGALLATLLVGRIRYLDASAGVFTAGLLLQALGHLFMGFSPVVLILVCAAAIAGFGNGMEAISGMTMLQQTKTHGSVGMLMGVVVSGSYVGNAVGSVAGGFLVEAAGPRWTFGVASFLMAGLSCLALRARQPGPDEFVAAPRDSFPGSKMVDGIADGSQK
ncbi:MFS transporter [Streptomyces sp. NBC_00258]|uniref:MFS transporter n=1 Tax=Streptomyces sp. NBC_00258 TaxID=2903642 RepID=UPI002E2AC28E|nr:MFS transporter [Streptomyces sp. NBC_00258]